MQHFRSEGGLTKPKLRSARPAPEVLLDFDACDTVELLGDRGCVFLGDVLLERLGSAVDQVLGFLEAEVSDFANRLDGRDLVGAAILEDDGELGLLLSRSGCGTATSCRGCRGDCCCRGDAQTGLELLDQLGCLEQAEGYDL